MIKRERKRRENTDMRVDEKKKKKESKKRTTTEKVKCKVTRRRWERVKRKQSHDVDSNRMRRTRAGEAGRTRAAAALKTLPATDLCLMAANSTSEMTEMGSDEGTWCACPKKGLCQ